MSEYTKRWRWKQRQRGLCVACAQPALDGQARCARHAEANRVRVKRHYWKKKKKGRIDDTDRAVAVSVESAGGDVSAAGVPVRDGNAVLRAAPLQEGGRPWDALGEGVRVSEFTTDGAEFWCIRCDDYRSADEHRECDGCATSLCEEHIEYHECVPLEES